ncbi:hypothetical protein BT69DRAFT_950472 [Atractiella rhizophila]|nr:hypothetical protein BT69DRAFT_950472 [Atractiella rhizophila]
MNLPRPTLILDSDKPFIAQDPPLCHRHYFLNLVDGSMTECDRVHRIERASHEYQLNEGQRVLYNLQALHRSCFQGERIICPVFHPKKGELHSCPFGLIHLSQLTTEERVRYEALQSESKNGCRRSRAS